MPPKSDLNGFKTKMKKETSRIINQLGLTDAESKILRTDAHNLVIEGKNEKSIIKDFEKCSQ